MSTTKKTATAVKANTQVKAPQVLAQYNRALDCVALAMELATQGRTAVAARAFFQAVKDPSVTAAIRTLDATNAYGLQAMTAAARLKAEADEAASDDMSDEEIDRLLNGDDVDADTEDGFDDPTDGLESLEDQEDEPEEILEEADMVEDEVVEDTMDDETSEFASVIARLTKVKAAPARVKAQAAGRVVVKPGQRRK